MENCNDHDGWVDTGDTRWIDDPGNECKEKGQKEQEYQDFTCSGGSCTYSVTDTQWIDTGATRNKADGTVCGYGSWEDDPANACKERREILKCVAGTCTPSGEYGYQNKPDGTICGCTANNTLKRCYDGSCSDTGICNSTICSADAACDGKKPGEDCGTDSKCNSTCKCMKITKYGVDLTAVVLEKTTTPNVNATYTLIVKNTGTLVDSYTLSVGNLDNAAIVSLNTSSVTNLPSGSSATVLLNVTDETPGIYNVSVTATSQGNSSVSDTIITKTTVREILPPQIVTYTITNRTITPPQTTEIDVEFSEEVAWRIAIEGSSVIYDWIGTSTNPAPKTWDGTYEVNGTVVPDGDYYVNVTGMSTTTGLSVINNTEIITVTTPDTTPPIISNVQATSITTSSATISWGTDEPSDSLVKYGTTSGIYTLTASNPANITSHSISLTGLSANTTYYYVVNSTDPSGNSAESGEYSFTTRTAPSGGIFDTGTGTYPSIMGTHIGTISPNQTITVQKLYTYPCAGTGGHTEYARIWNSSLDATANWTGYKGDWHNITFNKTFVLYKNKTYNYTIRTGSYPQIHHTPTLPTANGWINCTEFTDANGKKYDDWIPAIKLFF